MAQEPPAFDLEAEGLAWRHQHCSLCDMWLNGDAQMRDHLRGRRHRRNRDRLWEAVWVWFHFRLLPRSAAVAQVRWVVRALARVVPRPALRLIARCVLAPREWTWVYYNERGLE